MLQGDVGGDEVDEETPGDGGWSQVQDLLLALATEDLETTGDLRPCLAAFRGGTLRLLAFLRPFGKGAYQDPVIEVLALAMPLGADRLALAMSGRVWSLADPVPPVLPGEVDLRQRALFMHLVDGAGAGPPRGWSELHPFDLAGRQLTWHPFQRLPGATGWLAQALCVAVTRRDALQVPASLVAAQARRCARLGHELHLPAGVVVELGLTGGSPM